MIDLSYKPKKKENEQDLPPIFQLFLMLPFVVLVWAILTASFLHGIF